MQRATPTSTRSPIGSPPSRQASTRRVRAPTRWAGQLARAKAAASSAARCGSLSRIRIFGPSAADLPRRTTGLARPGCSFGQVLHATRPAASWQRPPPNRGCGGAREHGGGAPRRHTRSSRTSQGLGSGADSRGRRTRSRKRDTWPRSHRPLRDVPRRESFGQSNLAGSPMTHGSYLAGL